MTRGCKPKYVVRLTTEEREHLEGMIRTGRQAAYRLLKARILLKADVSSDGPGWEDARIAEALETSLSTVFRTRRQLVEEGLEATLARKVPASLSQPRIFDGQAEAKLIALACSEPPEEYTHWTLRLLEKRVVELGIVEQASDTTIQRTLKKNALKPHRNRYWVIPPKANAGFVAAMENVLDVYTRPHDQNRPLVCLDETSKQLTRETRTPIPMQPGREARHDYEYERAGVASLFMLFAPLEGWRHVEIRDRRTAIDYAHILRDLADLHFPYAEKIDLVQDNLNTHNPASLYEAFPPAQARRIAQRFEWHYTPKHGSWLNIAECELSVLARQCLARRIPDKTMLKAEVDAWTTNRNSQRAKTNWQFTTQDARTKLIRLYPQIE
ncbi:IS630 family transposase [Roseinatronobacter monicus]|uniref:IS630 family transposase n=1 Tax=Roseinatronobacter monicus TaxID=393481 RepID=UPI00115321FE|nr:IS630 family transposase [Roseinatronobacter monicus]